MSDLFYPAPPARHLGPAAGTGVETPEISSGRK